METRSVENETGARLETEFTPFEVKLIKNHWAKNENLI